MNNELKKILEELKDSAENPTVIYPTFDGSDEEKFENDKLLTPESCKLLFNYITQLQHNWNELKEWLIQLQKLKGINQQGFSWGVAQEVLDKMQELEGENNNEEKSNSK